MPLNEAADVAADALSVLSKEQVDAIIERRQITHDLGEKQPSDHKRQGCHEKNVSQYKSPPNARGSEKKRPE
jgi:hypothetical protein